MPHSQNTRYLNVQPVYVKPLATALLCGVMGMSMTACHKISKPIENPAASLVKLNQNQNVLSNVFNSNLERATTTKKVTSSFGKLGDIKLFGKKQQKAHAQTVTDLNIVNDGSGYVVASPNGTVSALDKQGKKQWQINLKQGIAAGVVANNDTVIVSDNNAHLIALDRQTGQKRWQVNMTSSVLSPSLIVNNRVVSLSNDGVISGLSLQTGAQIWQFATQTPTISVRGSATPILLDSQNALIATADGRIHAINIDNGTPLWSRRIGMAQGASEIDRLTDIDATPVVSDNMLYVVTYSGQLVGIDMAGQQINFLQNYASLKSVAVDSSQLYVTTLKGEVLALDKFTGKVVWQSDALANRGLSNPIVAKNYLIVGDASGYLHVFDTSTGKMLDRKHMNNNISSLTLNNNQLIAQSQTGNFSVWQVN